MPAWRGRASDRKQTYRQPPQINAPMKNFLIFALFIVGVAAVVAYWEMNHPFSYTKYRSWVADCEATAAKERQGGGSAAKPGNCDISFDAWMQLMLPAATRRDPSTSEKHDAK
jgi:hypothetical protein